MLLRGFLAVLAGLGVSMVLVVVFTWTASELMRVPANEPTMAYIIVNLIISTLAAVVGGYLTGRMAPSQPLAHAIGLGVFLFLLSLPMIISGPLLGQPTWYPTTIGIVGFAGALIGGLLAGRVEPDTASDPSGATPDRGV